MKENVFSADLLHVVGNDKELARLIMWHFGEHWPLWLNSAIPALDGKKPIHLIGSKKGRAALRSMLTKMP